MNQSAGVQAQMKIALALRRATAKDASQIACLLEELGYPRATHFYRSKIATLSRSRSDVVIVAENSGKVIGMAHLHTAEMIHEAGRLGRIMALVVQRRFRRLGVGRELMRHLESTCRSAGCVKVEVTSGDQRKGAHEFYRKLGYVEKPKRFVKRLV